jgi:hypothetical protein
MASAGSVSTSNHFHGPIPMQALRFLAVPTELYVIMFYSLPLGALASEQAQISPKRIATVCAASCCLITGVGHLQQHSCLGMVGEVATTGGCSVTFGGCFHLVCNVEEFGGRQHGGIADTAWDSSLLILSFQLPSRFMRSASHYQVWLLGSCNL